MTVAEENLAEQLVDALGGIYGRHDGYRAAHAKGALCAATFVAAPEARAFCRAPHLDGEPHRAHVRFSNGSGDPAAPDSARDGRGMAIKFYPPGGATTDIVALSIPMFFVRTPEDFLEFNRLRKPDPETGQPDLALLGPFLQAHPETLAAVQAALSMEPPESYLRTAYNGIHSLRFTGSDGGAGRWGRYRITPELGVATLSDEQAGERGADYLQSDLVQRLAAGPVGFSLEVVLAHDDDPIDDPTAAWPAERAAVTLGRLELTGLADDREHDGDILVFDPTRLADGIEASADPILAVRSAAYSVSVARRTVGS
jgi:catalase